MKFSLIYRVLCSSTLLVGAYGCTERSPEPGAGGTAGDSGSTTDGGSTSAESGAVATSDPTTGNADDESSSGAPPLPEDGLGPWGFDFVEVPDVELRAFVPGDFNGDGHLDFFARADTTSHIFVGDGTGQFTQLDPFGLPPSDNWFRAGDVDGDGHLDILAFDTSSADDFYVALNDGRAGFPSETFSQIDGFFGFGAIGLHLDDDDALDLFIPGGHSDGGLLALAQPDGTFIEDSSVTIFGCYGSDAAVADFDGDGLDEFVATGSCNSVPEFMPLGVYRRVGGVLNMVQMVQGTLAPLHEGSQLQLHDADGDGDLDALNGTDLGVHIAINEGDGVFGDMPRLVGHEYEGYSRGLLPLDLGEGFDPGYLLQSYEDRDNETAAVVTIPLALDSSTTTIVQMRGPLATDGRLPQTGDFDGDGRPDVAVLLGESSPYGLGLWLSGG